MANLSRRAEIRLGFRCNARCGFCYYQDKLDIPKDEEPSLKVLERQLRGLHNLGANEVEFTGGEPTIRNELAYLIGVAREIGFINISMVTNGLRTANREYAKKLVDRGLNDVLCSVHGHTGTVHDEHTAIPGSYAKVLESIRNFRALGIRVRSSTTITGRNVQFTESILRQSIKLGVDCIHLAVFSPAADANESNQRLRLSYTQAANSIKAAIDNLESQLPPLSVKYIPFCVMKGYERYVMNFYQQSYDPDDWNYYFSNRIRRASTKVSGLFFDAIALSGMLLSRNWREPAKNGLLGLKVQGFTKYVELIRKKRVPACRKCAYDSVCDHVWRDYVKHYGIEEFEAITGKKVRDPTWAYQMVRSRMVDRPLTRPPIATDATHSKIIAVKSIA